MREPVWLREDVVLAIHKRQIAEHGGAEGLRDAGLLASALAKPKNLLAYTKELADLPGLAASYAFGIARNHPFVDGNKRVALVACLTFLKLNESAIDASQTERYATFLKLAEGGINESELAAWLRNRLTTR